MGTGIGDVQCMGPIRRGAFWGVVIPVARKVYALTDIRPFISFEVFDEAVA